jgi:hypothetical protein
VPEQPTSTNDLIVAVKNALDRLIETVTAYQEANSGQREKEFNAESKTVVRLPVEITKYYESEERERPKTDSRDNIRMYLEIAGVGAAVVLAILTLLTLREVHKTTFATQQAAYAACVSTQVSQRELLEAQKTNSFSQAMAASSTMQAASEIDAEKAHITFEPRLPKQEDLLPNEPNFRIVYSYRNDGRSAASAVRIAFKAILVRNDEVFRINDSKIRAVIGDNYIPAGMSYPGTPEIGRPITPLITVVDTNGNSVKKDSPEVQQVFSDSAIIAVFGYIRYSDFAGSHINRFCDPLLAMQPGTTRKGVHANENTCARYDKEEDRYTFATNPKFSVPPEAPLPDVICQPPKPN